jgi:hypothetical protein
MARSLFTTSTNPAYYGSLVEDAAEQVTNWTISRHARPGDDVVLYVTAPISAIVAVATVETEPELCEDPRSEWLGKYFADMHSLRMLARPIERLSLRRAFYEWRYWKQPRQSVRVPDQYVEGLRALLIEHG